MQPQGTTIDPNTMQQQMQQVQQGINPVPVQQGNNPVIPVQQGNNP
jgi:hypothetical protein